MGQITPPREEPETTIPMARPRPLTNHRGTVAKAGRIVMAQPRPKRKPWVRKSVPYDLQREARKRERRVMTEPTFISICGVISGCAKRGKESILQVQTCRSGSRREVSVRT